MANIAAQAFVDNQIVPFAEATVSLASAPMLYGLAIYTVLMARYDTETEQYFIFRQPEHWERLMQSARIMDFQNFLDTWDYDKFSAMIHDLVRVNNRKHDALIRVTVYIDELMSGTRMRGLKNTLAGFMYDYEPLLNPKGASLCVSSWQRTNDAAIPSRAKNNGSYANASLIKNEALLNGFDDAVSLDERGHVCESSVANIFLVRGGTLITPDNASSLLEGITRRTVLEVAAAQGIATETRSIDRSELYIADEIFLCGSSARLTPVLTIDHRPIGAGSIGSLTQNMTDLFEKITCGQESQFAKWLTIIN